MKIKPVLDSLLNIAMPAVCASCRRKNSQFPLPICRDCRETLLIGPAPPLLINGHNMRTIYSLAPYRSAVRHCLHDLKFRANRRVLEILNIMIVSYSFGESLRKDKNGLIVPVPLHPSRYRSRGFNQSELIARKVSHHYLIPFDRNLLLKIRNTLPQTVLEREQRGKNLKNCFHCRKPSDVSGKDILLVDDIMTTGATLEECAGELMRSGARSVTGFTIARAL